LKRDSGYSEENTPTQAFLRRRQTARELLADFRRSNS
jgi:hypothetical protein